MPMVGKRCGQCGREFEACAKDVRRGGGKFCSRRCVGLSQKGAGNFNWQGGRSARHYVDRFRKKNPEKARAHDVVKNARRDGRLIPEPCEVCGAIEAATKIHAHHDDYSKPLAVRWFCGPHHRAHHRVLRDSQGDADVNRAV